MIKEAVLGNSNARAHLYEQYNKAMFNVCTRMMKNQQDAEDVLQEAFIIAFDRLHQLKDPESFGGWLRRIVVNECIHFGRKNFVTIEWNEEMENVGEDNEEWWTAVTPEMLHNEIKTLPEGCRQIFVLYVMEDYTHKDIAANLGVSESTSKSQYQRAKQLLRQRITQQLKTHG